VPGSLPTKFINFLFKCSDLIYPVCLLLMKTNKRIGNYLLKHEIGKGSFATVYLAYRVDEPKSETNKYAVKCINKEVIL